MEQPPAPFVIRHPPSGIRSPVVFDSPHSGRFIPPHFKYSCNTGDLARISDPYVDTLLKGIPAQGSPVLEAQIHRACIDLNRYEYEIDPRSVRGQWSRPSVMTPYTRKGMGLVHLHISNRAHQRLTPIFNEASRPTAQDIENRIDWYHRPYYAALTRLLDSAHAKFGQALHVDMHSMRRRDQGHDIVLGDLHGQSCPPDITEFIRAFFAGEDYAVSINKPFSGAALIRSTAQPDQKRYSIQIEIARDLYLDRDLLSPDPQKAEKITGTMTRLAAALQDYMARRCRPAPSPAPKT